MRYIIGGHYADDYHFYFCGLHGTLSKDLIMFPSISSSTNKDTAHIKGTGLGPQLIHKFAFAQQSNKHTK